MQKHCLSPGVFKRKALSERTGPYDSHRCLYESKDYEDAIRNCMAVGGDCDTTGAICGGIAEAVYGIPENLKQRIRLFLDDDQLEIIDSFRSRYITGGTR